MCRLPACPRPQGPENNQGRNVDPALPGKVALTLASLVKNDGPHHWALADGYSRTPSRPGRLTSFTNGTKSTFGHVAAA